MNIWLAYVSFPVTTAVYFERALRKKHNVITIGPTLPKEYIESWNLQSLKLPIKDLDIPTNSNPDLKMILNRVPRNIYPDLFIWIESVPGYHPVNIGNLNCPTAGLLIDTHMSLEAHLQWAAAFQHVFLVHKQFLPTFHAKGYNNVHWMPVGCDPEIHSKLSNSKLYDVGFVGTVSGDSQKRRRLLLEKINTSTSVTYKRCFWTEMAEFFSASKMVFNNAIKNDLNMRVFETMSTGTCLLTDQTKDTGQEQMFKDGEDLVLYDDENIIEKVKYYLVHEGEREKIAKHGQELVHKAHTYAHRSEELIKVCLGGRKTTPSPEEWRDRSISKNTYTYGFEFNIEKQIEKKEKKMTRSFIIPVLDMSPASPYNIVKLLDNLNHIEGDVIVIFNSLDMAEKLKDHPRIDYYASMKENVGVSRAWNIGLNISQTPVSFILNSDLIIQKEAVETIEKYLLELPDAAIAGPQGSFFNFNTLKDIAYFTKGSFDKPFAVDAVSGFFFAVKTELFNSGTLKFDNQFSPCYFEEWDIGLQCKMTGLKTYIIPVKGYEHEWSGSIRALRTIKYLKKEETVPTIYERNTKTFVDKWRGIAQLNGNKNLLVSAWADIMHFHADTLKEQNQNDEAVKVYNKILDEYPNNIDTLSKLAFFYYNKNILEKSLEYFSKIAEIDPEFQFSPDLFNDSASFTSKEPEITPDGILQRSSSPKPLSERITSYYENPRPDIQQLVEKSSKKILDIGCGSGSMAFELKNNLNAEVWGIELDKEAAGVAADRLDYVICDKVENTIIKLPNNYFDTIIFADVLEHLVNPYILLENIREKLSPDGEIIASLPNVRYWPVIRHLIEGHWTYQDSGILDFTHLRFFTLESIIEMFEKAGYSIIGKHGNVIPAAEVPSEILHTFQNNGLDVKTLSNETKYFQFIVRAKKK